MNDNRTEYRKIFKATSLFGGVQVISILISIAKSKIVALLLGVSGLGILGILNSSVGLILGISRMGLDFSSLKEISASKANVNPLEVVNKVAITKKITWFTGLLGAVIISLTSPILSNLAFGNQEFVSYFVIVALAVFFNQLTIGNHAILQGFGKLRKLALSSVFASFTALIAATIIYYFFKESGIPWVITITAILTYLFSRYYVSHIKLEYVEKTLSETFSEGKSMLKLGFVLGLGTLASLLCTYLLQITITNMSDIDEVGLYNAGFILINSYVLFFFSALSKDFFPRLAELSTFTEKMNKIINQQIILTTLLLAPILVLFLIFKTTIVKLLFTEEFLPILGMISFGIISTIFKAISWAIGFLIIIKGDSKRYVIIEIFSNILLFLSVIISYKYYGLNGVGVGYLIYYIVYALIVYGVVNVNYNFSLATKTNKTICIALLFCIATLCFSYFEGEFLRNLLLGIIGVFTLIYYFIRLNKSIGILEYIKNKRNKN